MADDIPPPDATAVPDSPPAEAAPPPVAVRFDRVDGWSFALTTLFAFAGYWITLTPNMSLSDTGLLSVGAMYAGVPSPPGYPAWTLYSWLFVKLIPFSNVAWRVALGSAVASAMACGLVALMVSYGGRMTCGGRAACSQANARDQNQLRMICGCVAGLVLAFSGTVWDYALIVDTRGFGLLLFVAVLCLLTRWFFEPHRKRHLWGAFFIFGLLLTNDQELIVALPGLVGAVMLANERLGRDLVFFVLPLTALATTWNQSNMIWAAHLTVINWPMLGMFLVVGLVGVALALKTWRIGTEWKCTLGCGMALLLGLAFYLYPPLASMTNPPVNWGYPRTVEGFLHVLGRGQFERVHPTDNFWTYLDQIGVLALITGKQLGWLYPGLALVPLVLMRRLQSAARRWLLVLLAAYLCVGFGLLAQINPPADRQAVELISAHFSPSFGVLAVLFGSGLIMIGAMVARTDENLSP